MKPSPRNLEIVATLAGDSTTSTAGPDARRLERCEEPTAAEAALAAGGAMALPPRSRACAASLWMRTDLAPETGSERIVSSFLSSATVSLLRAAVPS